MSALTSLPPELRYLIWLYLDPFDLGRAARLHKQANQEIASLLPQLFARYVPLEKPPFVLGHLIKLCWKAQFLKSVPHFHFKEQLHAPHTHIYTFVPSKTITYLTVEGLFTEKHRQMTLSYHNRLKYETVCADSTFFAGFNMETKQIEYWDNTKIDLKRRTCKMQSLDTKHPFVYAQRETTGALSLICLNEQMQLVDERTKRVFLDLPKPPTRTLFDFPIGQKWAFVSRDVLCIAISHENQSKVWTLDPSGVKGPFIIGVTAIEQMHAKQDRLITLAQNTIQVWNHAGQCLHNAGGSTSKKFYEAKLISRQLFAATTCNELQVSAYNQGISFFKGILPRIQELEVTAHSAWIKTVNRASSCIFELDLGAKTEEPKPLKKRKRDSNN